MPHPQFNHGQFPPTFTGLPYHMLPARHVTPADCMFSNCCLCSIWRRCNTLRGKSYQPAPTHTHELTDTHDWLSHLWLTGERQRERENTTPPSLRQRTVFLSQACGGCGIIRVRAHDFQGMRRTLSCCSTQSDTLHFIVFYPSCCVWRFCSFEKGSCDLYSE